MGIDTTTVVEALIEGMTGDTEVEAVEVVEAAQDMVIDMKTAVSTVVVIGKNIHETLTVMLLHERTVLNAEAAVEAAATTSAKIIEVAVTEIVEIVKDMEEGHTRIAKIDILADEPRTV